MEDGWYYRSGDEECGPMAIDELVRAFARGKLRATDSVRWKSTGDWKSAGSYRLLVDAKAEYKEKRRRRKKRRRKKRQKAQVEVDAGSSSSMSETWANAEEQEETWFGVEPEKTESDENTTEAEETAAEPEEAELEETATEQDETATEQDETATEQDETAAESEETATEQEEAATESEENSSDDPWQALLRGMLDQAGVLRDDLDPTLKEFRMWCNGREMGPFSFNDLVEMGRENSLNATDWVRRQDSEEWAPLMPSAPDSSEAPPADDAAAEQEPETPSEPDYVSADPPSTARDENSGTTTHIHVHQHSGKPAAKAASVERLGQEADAVWQEVQRERREKHTAEPPKLPERRPVVDEPRGGVDDAQADIASMAAELLTNPESRTKAPPKVEAPPKSLFETIKSTSLKVKLGVVAGLAVIIFMLLPSGPSVPSDKEFYNRLLTWYRKFEKVQDNAVNKKKLKIEVAPQLDDMRDVVGELESDAARGPLAAAAENLKILLVYARPPVGTRSDFLIQMTEAARQLKLPPPGGG